MDGLLSRVLAEEDKYITHLKDQINELASELRVRTDALEQAYERVRSADKRTVEMHKKYLAEANARANAETETKKAQEETKKAQLLLDVTKRELEHARDDVERLEAERAEAESAAGRARAVARELKQTIKVGRAREIGMAEGRAPEDRLREKENQEAMAAAVREAYERGKAEGEASATMKALAAFDKLMETDELAGWDEDAKISTRQEIKQMARKPSTEGKASAERAKSPQPSPPRRKWSIRRGSSSN
jgi:chromosome segregation ATPase